MGNKNIKNYGVKFTKENASDMGKRGGQKSVQARAAAGRLRERLLAYAASPSENDPAITKEDAIAIAIVYKAVQGDAKAADQYAELTDQRVIKTESKVEGINIEFGAVFSEDGE